MVLVVSWFDWLIQNHTTLNSSQKTQSRMCWSKKTKNKYKVLVVEGRTHMQLCRKLKLWKPLNGSYSCGTLVALMAASLRFHWPPCQPTVLCWSFTWKTHLSTSTEGYLLGNHLIVLIEQRLQQCILSDRSLGFSWNMQELPHGNRSY